jgi:CCR4-NOT transcription complex subunit 9
MAANGNGNNGHGMHMEHSAGPNSTEGNWIEENRRVLGWVAELLNGNSRETALMELSKKREQVPELALIIWHSFGESSDIISTWNGC